ncbi:MAG: aquaporin, partial [Phycisphaerales bacterium]|nr:aquaporin [Phycisphaerales bacterium]
KKTEGNSYYGLAIGFTVTAGAATVGGISGGAFNPAVGTGPLLMQTIVGEGSLGNLWMYWVGPVVGALVAALVFKLQCPDE